jgi:hypothetical protein
MNKKIEDVLTEQIRNNVFNDVLTVIQLNKQGMRLEQIVQKVDLGTEQILKILYLLSENKGHGYK